jgi:2-polyprenyl-6-methoxyphenol hydroxylase-like FAD-dependent oxidoreductase
MARKSHERRAIVVGGSIAGLFVGAFLRRIGWRVDIFERSSIELIGRGVGIFATHLELLEALDKCEAGTVDIGVIVYKRITFGRKGNVIAEKPQLQIVTSWDRLRQVLLKAIDRQHYHFGHAFERVEQDGNGVEVHFANNRRERADLLIGCDGFRSTVRGQLAPEAQPIYSGYYIWRGAPNEADLSADTRRTMFPYFSFFLGEQLQALGYPISGMDDELRAGHRRYNFGWYRVADAATLKQMWVDDNGREYEFGVPPPLVRKDLIEQMRAKAEKGQFDAGDIGPISVSQIACRTAQARAKIDNARAFRNTGSFRQRVIGVQPAVVILVVRKQFSRFDVVEMASACIELRKNDFE